MFAIWRASNRAIWSRFQATCKNAGANWHSWKRCQIPQSHHHIGFNRRWTKTCLWHILVPSVLCDTALWSIFIHGSVFTFYSLTITYQIWPHHSYRSWYFSQIVTTLFVAIIGAKWHPRDPTARKQATEIKTITRVVERLLKMESHHAKT